MYYYYNLVCGHNQLFVSAIRDNYYRGFDLFMSILEKFVERLRELLTDHEMKPAHLAKELGVTRKVICRYTNGERLPSLNMAFRLSGYFHCSIDFFSAAAMKALNLNLFPFRRSRIGCRTWWISSKKQKPTSPKKPISMKASSTIG